MMFLLQMLCMLRDHRLMDLEACGRDLFLQIIYLSSEQVHLVLTLLLLSICFAIFLKKS